MPSRNASLLSTELFELCQGIVKGDQICAHAFGSHDNISQCRLDAGIPPGRAPSAVRNRFPTFRRGGDDGHAESAAVPMRSVVNLRFRNFAVSSRSLRFACAQASSRPVLFNSRCNQTRAAAQFRFTVAGETPVTTAVSSIDRPPKKRNSTMRAC
jgi:hypothetical protein